MEGGTCKMLPSQVENKPVSLSGQASNARDPEERHIFSSYEFTLSSQHLQGLLKKSHFA